jgi:hypothetical protein
MHQYLVAYFEVLPWLSKSDPQEEPSIQPDDDLVTMGFIKSTLKSRFYAFISAEGREYICLIPHTIKKGREEIHCNKRFKVDKNALAHVRDYFGYKAYKCQGKTEEGEVVHAAW